MNKLILQHGSLEYRVDVLVAETSTYRVYICEDVASGRQYLLQIAMNIQDNGGLERAAYVLKTLRSTADLFEAEFAKQETGKLLSYERLFPEVIESFISAEQGKRRINILAIAEVEDVKRLVPLSNLRTKDGLRIDLSSSAWVMGRLLKLLAFTHGENITVNLSANNVLLEPSRHFVVVFDWSTSMLHQSELTPAVRAYEIASAALDVFAAIGGDIYSGEYPYDGEDEYIKFIWRLSCKRENNAERAHEKFYELVEKLWGCEFRPFKTLPL